MCLLIPGSVFAQASPGGIITDRPSTKRLPLPEYTRPEPPPDFELPPVTPPPTDKPTEGGPRVTIERFRFNGNSVFSDQALETLAAPYLNRPISTVELEEIRHKLTQLYIDKGYINSGAILPRQVFKDGIIDFQIIEGELTDIRVTGQSWLDPDYISDRLYLGAGPPLNNTDLQDRFQLLLTDPLIDSMDGRLLPGFQPGQSILDVKVARARPYQLSITADNYRPPSTGSETVSMDGWVRNLTGFGDFLGVSLSYGEGRFDIDTAASVPINRYDTVLGFRYANTHASVIEEPLDTIDIDNRFRSFEVSLIQPIYRTLERQVILGVRVEARKSRNTLLGRPFSFSLGEENGEKSSTTRIAGGLRKPP